MGAKIAYQSTLRMIVPPPVRMSIALIGAACGTATYFLLPDLSWREDIPALTVLVAASMYLGFRIAGLINRFAAHRLRAATASVNDEEVRASLQSMRQRFPRRSVAFRWCTVMIAVSYFLVILVGIPILIAALAIWGLGSAAGVDAVVMTWVRQTGMILAVALTAIGIVSCAFWFKRALGLLGSMHTGIERVERSQAAFLESQIEQFIPGELTLV